VDAGAATVVFAGRERHKAARAQGSQLYFLRNKGTP